MNWIKVILELLATGLEWWKERSLLQAGRAQEKVENNEKTIAALAARDSVSADDVDRMLKPPSER